LHRYHTLTSSIILDIYRNLFSDRINRLYLKKRKGQASACPFCFR
jgi:hypothetical protein